MSKITEEGSTTSLAKTDDIFVLQGGTGQWVQVQKVIDLDAAAALDAPCMSDRLHLHCTDCCC